MKNIYTLLTLAVVIGMSSCSSSRNAQNTDDIYYSDGTRKAVSAGGANQGDYYSTAPSDNYVRMKTEDYDRWSTFDDYNAYDAYYAPGYSYGYYPGVSYGLGFGYGMGMGYGLGFGYGMGFYDPWMSYCVWNSWYNPYFYNSYYGGAVFVSSGHGIGAGSYSSANPLRPFNQMSYRNGVANKVGTSNGRFYRPGMAGTTAYNSRLTNSPGGRTVNNTYYNNRPANNNNYRPAFNNNNSNNSNFNRSYTPSRSFGGSSGGGGGGFRAGGGGGGGGFRGH